MQYRRLGRTGCTVSEIGFGAWGIGGAMWRGSDDVAALAALDAAFDLGVSFVDTAFAYGDGHSERLIGRALERRREPIVVASKIAPATREWPAPSGSTVTREYPAGYVERCAETSAANLGRAVDVLQFHTWQDAWLEEPEWKKVEQVLSRLVARGTVRHVGISNTEHDPESGLEAVRRCALIECLQVIYNLFDQSAARRLLPACRARDVGVIVRVPLDVGGLTGTVRPGVVFPPADWRHRYFRDERPAEVERHVERLRPLLLREATSVADGALRWCLSHEAVSTVIAGMRTAEHAHANVAASDGRLLTAGLLEELKGHAWERNYYK